MPENIGEEDMIPRLTLMASMESTMVDIGVHRFQIILGYRVTLSQNKRQMSLCPISYYTPGN